MLSCRLQANLRLRLSPRFATCLESLRSVLHQWFRTRLPLWVVWCSLKNKRRNEWHLIRFLSCKISALLSPSPRDVCGLVKNRCQHLQHAVLSGKHWIPCRTCLNFWPLLLLLAATRYVHNHQVSDHDQCCHIPVWKFFTSEACREEKPAQLMLMFVWGDVIFTISAKDTFICRMKKLSITSLILYIWLWFYHNVWFLLNPFHFCKLWAFYH